MSSIVRGSGPFPRWRLPRRAPKSNMSCTRWQIIQLGCALGMSPFVPSSAKPGARALVGRDQRLARRIRPPSPWPILGPRVGSRWHRRECSWRAGPCSHHASSADVHKHKTRSDNMENKDSEIRLGAVLKQALEVSGKPHHSFPTAQIVCNKY